MPHGCQILVTNLPMALRKSCSYLVPIWPGDIADSTNANSYHGKTHSNFFICIQMMHIYLNGTGYGYMGNFVHDVTIKVIVTLETNCRNAGLGISGTDSLRM